MKRSQRKKKKLWEGKERKEVMRGKSDTHKISLLSCLFWIWSVQELTQQLPSKVLFWSFVSILINRYKDVFAPSRFSMYTTPQSERHTSVTHLGMKMLISVFSGVQIWSFKYWIVETKKGHRNSARWLSSNTYHARGDQILYRPIALVHSAFWSRFLTSIKLSWMKSRNNNQIFPSKNLQSS
jgi:hypothetical protein